MLFSENFNITRGREDDWLDIILDADTKLFVDPFLIFREVNGEWSTAHADIIEHFQVCFELIAQGNMQPASLPYRKALALLAFKEPREFCLGYTSRGSDGAGGGPGYARLFARAMVQAINRGLADLKHFEELGILDKGIGPDRIGDLTCNILKARFIAYTKSIAKLHSLPTVTQVVPNAGYDAVGKRWISQTHELPRNPETGRAILLTPERFIRDVPILNAEDWWDYYQNEQLRLDVNYEILTNVNKETIVQKARQNPQAVRDWTDQQADNAPATPYNLEKDRNGVYAWDADTRLFAKENPLALGLPSTNDQFLDVVSKVIQEFKLYIEEQRGWKLLWNDDGTEKNEEAAQLAFYGLARSYCKQNDIVVDREVELGRGPVDFKFSNGYTFRALLEIKKLHSGGFWNGIESQLPSYMKSDDCQEGWYVAIRYRPKGTSKNWALRLPGVIKKVSDDTNKNFRFVLIDGMKKKSASKVK